jgi:serine/threonine-protein kinase
MPSERGVVDLYMEPELAKARRTSKPSPPACAAGEQYALAALLYFLLTGAHTHKFVLEQDELLRQIIEDPPLPFAEHAATGNDELERVLGRALSKSASDRFDSVAEFAHQISLAVRLEQGEPSNRPSVQGRSSVHIFLDDLIDALSTPGSFRGKRLDAPTASFQNGAAGIAYTLLRIARARDDEQILAIADLWSNRAVQDVLSSSRQAFYSDSLELTPQSIGAASLYHGASGVYCVDALVAHSRGDTIALQRAVNAFIAASDVDSSQTDVANGWAGSLLGCSFLLDAQSALAAEGEESLRRLGGSLMARIWCELIRSPALLKSPIQMPLGAAHGWAGWLYAILRWCESSGVEVPDGMDRRLGELAALATPIGSGLRWPVAIGPQRRGSSLWSSWCNGAAGFVHLWTSAARHYGEQLYSDMATGAAWASYQAPFASADLCCGLAGRAYALLNVGKHTGDPRWVERARELADRAAARIRTGLPLQNSLYKGDVGIGLLISDFTAPDFASMPLYENEGWHLAGTTGRA